jgi:hypothetical protein
LDSRAAVPRYTHADITCCLSLARACTFSHFSSSTNYFLATKPINKNQHQQHHCRSAWSPKPWQQWTASKICGSMSPNSPPANGTGLRHYSYRTRYRSTSCGLKPSRSSPAAGYSSCCCPSTRARRSMACGPKSPHSAAASYHGCTRWISTAWRPRPPRSPAVACRSSCH